LGENLNTIKRNTETLLHTGLEGNVALRSLVVVEVVVVAAVVFVVVVVVAAAG
jgi:hypothetical protein